MCTPNDKCFCDGGWEGADCSLSSNTTLLEEGQLMPDNDSAPLFSATTVEVKAIALSELNGGVDRGDIFRDTNTPATAPVTEGTH